MYFSDYYKNSITYSDAQFVIAIALDQLNDLDAARLVIDFLSPACVHANAVDSVKRQRQELSEKLSQDGRGIVYATLDYYYNNSVFSASKRSRVTKGKNLYPLSRIARSSLNMVYDRAMQLISENPVNKLIAIYTKTQMFTKEFISFVRSNSATSGKRSGSGAIPESTALELATKFTQFVYENCADGAYYTSSCTPNSFLFAKKNDGSSCNQTRPIEWFQCSNNGEYYDILNRKGTNTDVGEDLTLLDSVEIDLSKNECNISFILTCEKISKASALLFTHNNSIYFDILSYHKKVISAELKNDIESLKLLGINFSYGYDINEICEGKDNLRNKFKSRCSICDVFEEILQNGIRKEDINHLYTRLINLSRQMCSNASGTKDAKSIFSFDNYTSREVGTNGSKMITLLEGYAALRDLIDFLESDSNTRGISLEEFPCDIFRYPLLLKRFKSFEQYIDYGAEVKELYHEVSASSDRSAPYLDEVYSNDYVYDVLKNSQLIRQDVTLQAIAETPFNAIQGAVSLFETAGKDNEFTKAIENVYKIWGQNLDCLDELVSQFGLQDVSDLFDVMKLQKLDQTVLQLLTLKLSTWVMGKIKIGVEVARQQLLNYLIVSAFATCVRATSLQKTDKPICDISGHYLLRDEGLTEVVYFPDALAQSFPLEKQQQILLFRARAMEASMFFLWGEESDREKLGTFSASWMDIRNYWYVTTKMARFILKNIKLLNTVYGDRSDLSLMKIQTVTDLRIMHLAAEQSEPKSVSDFAILRDPIDPEYTLPDASRDESAKLSKSLNDRFCKSFKSFFECIADLREIYANLIIRSDTTFDRLNSFISVNNVQETLLSKAADSVIAKVLSGEARPREEQILSTVTEFDELGYAISGTSRFCADGKFFIHKKGYVVELNQKTGTHFINELKEDMIMKLKQSLI